MSATKPAITSTPRGRKYRSIRIYFFESVIPGDPLKPVRDGGTSSFRKSVILGPAQKMRQAESFTPYIRGVSMSCEHLRRFIDESTAAQMKTWIEKQTLIARAYLSGLRRRLGPQPMANLTPIELPDEDAIINETFKRILGNHDDGYVWDGATAPTTTA
jgi:hypothetical protein